MVKYLIKGLCILTLTFAVQVKAAGEVVVVDIQTAILASEEAKQMIGEFKKQVAPDEKEMKTLAETIQTLQRKLEQDNAVMSDSEKKKLAQDIEDSALEFKVKRKRLAEASQEAQNELLIEMRPKIEKVLGDIWAANDYAMVLDRKAVISVKPDLDITKKVTEQLNLLK